MDFGIVLPNTGELGRPDTMIAIAERAEALGFAALWTADHLVLPVESDTPYPYLPGMNVRPDPRRPFVDPMIALAGVATRTKRIGLGVSVYLAALRHPIVAAKLVASLDQLSGGRVRLGVGAGWVPEEYETLGIEFRRRGEVLDEHIACMRALWSEAAPRFEGRFYRVDNVGFEPKPIQDPLPILIGGNSAPARRRAARIGDGWHVIDVPLDALEAGIADLRMRTRAAGRPEAAVRVSMRAQVAITDAPIPVERRFAPLLGPLPDLVRDLRRMRDLGVDHVALWPAGREDDLDAYLAHLERFATELIPAVGDEA